MLSRVADAVYWMGRYVERAENVARFADVSQHLALDLPAGTAEPWLPLVATTGDEEDFKARYGSASPERVIEFLATDRQNPNSIASCLWVARENARSIREIISSEMWRELNRAYLFASSAERKRVIDEPHEFFETIKRAAQMFVGVTYLTMTHNEAWHFARLGRLLERADKTSRIVDVKYFLLLPDVADVGTTYDELGWGALLKSASAFEMYRKRHGPISPVKVLDFLLLERRFPRSVRYCLTKANRSLHAITGEPPGGGSTLAERELGRMATELDFVDVREVIQTGMHEYLDALQTKLNRSGSAICSTFFAALPSQSGAQSQ